MGAKDVETFFEFGLRHTQGELAGQPFKLADWQKRDIIRPLFDTLRPDGTRQYRTCYVEIPRKNGKTNLAAGIALYLLFADKEPGAYVVSAAADRDQARLCFDLARQMVQANPTLSAHCTIYKNEIKTHKGGTYKVLSADAFTKHGLNLSGIIFDELHVQPNRELWDVLQTSTPARRQPLTFAITTAGHDRESLCFELHTYAKGILSGTIQDPGFLPVIYSAKDQADWKQEPTWKAANPNYGVSVKGDYFEQQVREAMASPGKEMAFRQLHLNQWTESAVRWISLDKWDECQGELPDLAGRACWAGLDLSSTIDLSALVLAFPIGDEIWLKPFCWAPQHALRERERRNKARFDIWAKQGFLEATQGEVINYETIRATIQGLGKQYKIKEIALDRWNATQLATQLQGDGFEMVAFGQGYQSMSPAAKDLEALVLSKKLRHDGHPVLKWCLGNVVCELDGAGNIKPSKKRSSEKIDLAVAACMAVARCRLGQVAASSVYEARGPRVF